MRFFPVPSRWKSINSFQTTLCSLDVMSICRYRLFGSSNDLLKYKQRIVVELKACDLDESFVKGSGMIPVYTALPDLKLSRIRIPNSDTVVFLRNMLGKGGQKINKVRNCVLLTHLPTGLQVRTQKTRSLDDNRRVARKLLLQKLDDHVNGSLSKQNEKIAQLRRKKANRRAKSKQKYATADCKLDGNDGKEDDEGEADVGEHMEL